MILAIGRKDVAMSPGLDPVLVLASAKGKARSFFALLVDLDPEPNPWRSFGCRKIYPFNGGV